MKTTTKTTIVSMIVRKPDGTKVAVPGPEVERRLRNSLLACSFNEWGAEALLDILRGDARAPEITAEDPAGDIDDKAPSEPPNAAETGQAPTPPES